MASAAAALDDSRYGFIGHFRLKDQLKEAAKAAGLEIRQQGMFSRSYRVTPVFNHARLGDIIPSHIHSVRERDGSHTMQRNEIKQLLSFMHQPLRAGLSHATEKDIRQNAKKIIRDVIDAHGDLETIPKIFLELPMAAIKNYEKQRHEQASDELRLVRRILSFGTNGTVNPAPPPDEIKARQDIAAKEKLEQKNEKRIAKGKDPIEKPEKPERPWSNRFHHQAAQVTDDDEHVAIVEQMDAERNIRDAVEMGGKFIPGAHFDKTKGRFIIPINAELRGNGFEGKGQNELGTRILGIIKEIVPGQETQNKIELTANQLTRFSEAIHRDAAPLSVLVDTAAHEEHVQYAVGQIEKRAARLQKDELFAKLTAAKGPADSAQHLNNLLKSTSALSGLLKSPLLDDAWQRYNFTERHNSPLQNLQKEAEAFRSVVQHYIDRGNITPQELEAITNEFFPLMMFGAEAMQTFRRSLEKSTVPSEDAQLCRELEDQFRGACLIQDALARKHMPEDKRKVLESFSIYTGEQKYSATKKVGEVLHNYGKDIINSVREHPKLTVSVVVTIVALLRIAAAMQPASSQPLDPSKAIESVMFIQGDGSVLWDNMHKSELEQQAFSTYHMDMSFTDINNLVKNWSPMKRHYFGTAAANLAELGEMWRAPLKAAMELTGHPVKEGLASMRTDDHVFLFEKVFNETLPKIDRWWLYTNVPQDLSHAGYWGWSWSKGLFSGLAGTAALFKLFNPVIDMGYTGGRAIGDKLSFRNKKKDAREAIADILKGVERPVPAERKSVEEGHGPTIPVRNAWIGERIAAYANKTVEETQNTINRLGLAATHLGEEAGIADKCRRQTIQNEIAALGKIFSGGDKDFASLQKNIGKHLARVAALEVAQTGRSSVFDTFLGNGEGMDEKTARKLKRLGTHVLRTGDYNQIRKNETAGFYWRMSPLRNAWAATKIAGVTIAEGFSHVMNGARLAKESKISDAAFDPRLHTKFLTTVTRPAVAIVGAVSGTSIWLDHSNKIKDLPEFMRPVIEIISQSSAFAAATAFGTANFLGWNVLVSDLLQVHFVTGLALSTLAAAMIHYPGQYGLKPISHYFQETRRELKRPGKDSDNDQISINSPEML